jgi:hypothetical protein
MGRNLNRYLDGTASVNVDAERPPLINEMLHWVGLRFAGYLLVMLGSAAAFFVWATFYVYVWPGKPPVPPPAGVLQEAPTPPVAPNSPIPAEPPAGFDPAMAAAVKQVPSNALPTMRLWKLPVYDPSNAQVGQIEDVLVGHDGKVVAYIVGVGVGSGQSKNIAVPFQAVQFRNDNARAVLFMTKDAVQSAPKQKFDQYKMNWVPDTAR